MRDQIADEGELEDGEHHEDENDGGDELRGDRCSRGRDAGVYE